MRRMRVGTGVLVAVAALVLTAGGCGEGGDLTFHNDGPEDVSVVWDEGTLSIDAGGGVQILGSGCTEGDVVITFPSGKSRTLTGPVCPDRAIVIGDGEVDLREP
ncbi:hypothetical protein [Kineococcus sp. SYSU DK006]|uniref:hypothetical protein n=1 Tax=Kineococcus sp. SYSU DK006 TaxID=3383127 RepID=UPI003D7E81B4